MIAWSSLVAAAGFARVPLLSAVRALLLPVITGLIVAIGAAVFCWN